MRGDAGSAGAEGARRGPLLLLALAAGLCLALPPEVHPEVGILATAALLAGHLRAPRPLPLLVPVIAVVLVLFNQAVSAAPGRTIDMVARAALPLAAGTLAWRLPREADRPLLGTLGAVGAAVGLYAVVQAVWLLPRLAEQAQELALPGSWAERIALGRPAAEHVVPAALAGALALAAAALAALVHERSGRRVRIAAIAGLVGVGAGLVATTSLGGWLALLAGGGLVALAVLRRRVGLRPLLVGLAALLAFAVLLAAVLRPDPIFDLTAPDHPLSLRVGNWRGALLVWSHAPVTGVGLGGFGALYPAVRRPLDTETIYAHNSWLQLVAEGGLPLLVLLALAAGALGRRWRRAAGADLWLLGGVTAFAVHNLVDFTAYLPGVAVPAAALAGRLFAAPRAPAPVDRPRGGGALLAAALLPVLVLWSGEALARRQLERSWELARAPAPAAAAEQAAAAAGWAPWSSRVALDAARLVAGSASPLPPARTALAEPLAWRALRDDPLAPGPWHLLGDLYRLRGQPAGAWAAWSLARQRHPAGEDLATKLAGIEQAFTRTGGLTAPLHYGGATPGDPDPPWEAWDDLLLLAGVVLVLLAVVRWWRGGPAPAYALALASALLLSLWGEGGALPGVRLARALLVVVAALAWLWPRGEPSARRELPAFPALVALGAIVIGIATAARAPDAAAARDGLATLVAAVVVLVLSAALARRYERWPALVLDLVAVAAVAVAALWGLQRALLAGGVDLVAASGPLRVLPGVAPAADLLHPGHLGTFLLAAGGAVVAAALLHPRPARLRVAAGTVLALAGVLAGARASLVALAAMALVALLLPWPRPVRRRLAGGLVVAAVLGALAVWWRFRTGADPFAWSRLAIWQASAAALTERPWLGYGPGGFGAVAQAFVLPEPSVIAQYARTFRTPHSDLLGALLAFGVPGGVALVGGLAALGRRALHAARAQPDRPALAGACLFVAALAGHGLVDDLLAARPLAWVAGALLLGAASGAGPVVQRSWRAGPVVRGALAVAVFAGLLAGEALPWAADRFYRAGRPATAARLDPHRATYQLALARTAGGPPAERLATALHRASRAVSAAPGRADPWRELAQIAHAACGGPLPTADACALARDLWSAVIAREPTDVFARRRRAQVARRMDASRAAEADLRLALTIEPAFLGARLDLLDLLGDARRRSAAAAERRALVRVVETVAGHEPANPRERFLLRLTPREHERLAATIAEETAGSGSP